MDILNNGDIKTVDVSERGQPFDKNIMGEIDLKEKYEVNMYDGICVIQNLNIIPGGMYGN